MRLPYIRTVPVADMELPAELDRLYDLAYNLWWTWQPRAHTLFGMIDPVRWPLDHNPVELLINVAPQRWESLLVDENFMASYNALIQDFDRYIRGAAGSAWFPSNHPDYRGGPVAYFSAEFGWHESLGIYSGGLGILAGDHCKAASDLGLPFVGIGLMYRRGYFRQTIDAEGQQQHLYADYDLRRLPVLPVSHPNGRRVRIGLDFPGRTVHVRLWKATVGRVPVILLDTDCFENDPADRPITSILYVRGRDMRLCQEIVLGVGGVRALRALGVEPEVWHMNEGHSALLSLERIHREIENGSTFTEAVAGIRKRAVFTTHTPVAAGNEAFDNGLIRKYLSPHAESFGVDLGEMLAMGSERAGTDDGRFNLTALAIRTSRSTNGVSELHGRVANEMWRHLWPAEAGPTPVGHVTNGVHIPTWMGPEMAELLRQSLGDHPDALVLDPGFAEAVGRIPDEEVWTAHSAQKIRLTLYARRMIRAQFARHGRSPDELREVDALLDPAALTVGFARRFATYKRAALIFHDVGRLRAILTHTDRPVQLLFAGKAHPADRPGQDLIRRIFHYSLSPEFRGRIVFLENYNMQVARHLVQGVDLWLNTPRRPLEASGTSGMKVAINGGLNFSVLDGWWCEGYDPAHGWTIGSPAEYSDPEAQDRDDADSLYSVFAQDIVPAYYDRDTDTGIPRRWISRMKRAIGDLAPRFSAARVIREYTERVYLPDSHAPARADGGGQASSSAESPDQRS